MTVAAQYNSTERHAASEATPVPSLQQSTSAAEITRDPRRLAALCELWQSEEREVWITLKGESMVPTLFPGSRLRLHCRRRDLRVGEIIAFRRGGMLLVHRIIEMPGSPGADEQIVCQGDANPLPDEPVAPADVIGRIVQVRPPALPHRIRITLRRLVRRWEPAARVLDVIRGRRAPTPYDF